MKTTFFIVCWLIGSLAHAQGSSKYFGATNTEAKLEYHSKIEIKSKYALKLSQLKVENGDNYEIFEEIRTQVSFLIGHFSSESFKAEVGVPGVLGENMNFTVTKVENFQGYSILHLKTVGKVVFHKDVFKGKSKARIPLRLPLSIERTYELGIVDGVNRCTDEHYNSLGDFFYFWDIDKSGCPLKGNNREIVRVDGELTVIDNTKKTYPEYDKLYQKPVLDIRLLMGYIGDHISLNEVDYNDDGYLSFKGTVDELQSLGFKIVERKTKFRLSANDHELKGTNYLYVLEKEVRNNLGQTQIVRVTAFLGDTDINSKDLTFHKVLIPAYQEADLLVYDGHSGLGANLSFDYLPEFTFDTTGKYQLFFINGCSSYPYYNGQFFRNKEGGSKNIDIITSGLSTYTSTSVSNTMAFLAPFVSGRTWSYQTLLRHMEVSNGDAGTYLTGVNGDEDNLFQP
tara:strand:- start:8631 stop:9992 length:1362 start_codon:yes stop_codon:yes gene_type:complete